MRHWRRLKDMCFLELALRPEAPAFMRSPGVIECLRRVAHERMMEALKKALSQRRSILQ